MADEIKKDKLTPNQDSNLDKEKKTPKKKEPGKGDHNLNGKTKEELEKELGEEIYIPDNEPKLIESELENLEEEKKRAQREAMERDGLERERVLEREPSPTDEPEIVDGEEVFDPNSADGYYGEILEEMQDEVDAAEQAKIEAAKLAEAQKAKAREKAKQLEKQRQAAKAANEQKHQTSTDDKDKEDQSDHSDRKNEDPVEIDKGNFKEQTAYGDDDKDNQDSKVDHNKLYDEVADSEYSKEHLKDTHEDERQREDARREAERRREAELKAQDAKRAQEAREAAAREQSANEVKDTHAQPKEELRVEDKRVDEKDKEVDNHDKRSEDNSQHHYEDDYTLTAEERAREQARRDEQARIDEQKKKDDQRRRDAQELKDAKDRREEVKDTRTQEKDYREDTREIQDDKREAQNDNKEKEQVRQDDKRFTDKDDSFDRARDDAKRREDAQRRDASAKDEQKRADDARKMSETQHVNVGKEAQTYVPPVVDRDDRHEQLHKDIEKSEYSRDHKREQNDVRDEYKSNDRQKDVYQKDNRDELVREEARRDEARKNVQSNQDNDRRQTSHNVETKSQDEKPKAQDVRDDHRFEDRRRDEFRRDDKIRDDKSLGYKEPDKPREPDKGLGFDKDKEPTFDDVKFDDFKREEFPDVSFDDIHKDHNSTGSSYDHDKLRQEIENSDYSRNHKVEQQETVKDEKIRDDKISQVDRFERQTGVGHEDTVSSYSNDTTRSKDEYKFEDYKGQDTSSQRHTASEFQKDIDQKSYDVVREPEKVKEPDRREGETDKKVVGAVNRDVEGADRGYDHDKLIKDIENSEYSRAHQSYQDANKLQGVDIDAYEAAKNSDLQSKDEKRGSSPIGDQKVFFDPSFDKMALSPKERGFYSDVGVPMSVAREIGNAYQDVTVDAKTGVVNVPEGIAQPDYRKAAYDVLRAHEDQMSGIRADIKVAETELAALKADGATKNEINRKTAELNKQRVELSRIQDEHKRVSDFLEGKNPISGQVTNKTGVGENALGGSEYSRGHRADLGKQASMDASVGAGVGKDGKLWHVNTDIKLVQEARTRFVQKMYASKFGTIFKDTLKKAAREDEDIDKEEEVIDTTNDARKLVMSHIAVGKLKKELQLLGADHDTIMQELDDIGVIIGVGDVRELTLEQLESSMADSFSTLSSHSQKQLQRAIGLKAKSTMNDIELANELLKEAGEFAKFSLKDLQKLADTHANDIAKQIQIQAAIKYHDLGKWAKLAGGGIKIAKGMFSTFASKVFHKSEYMGDVVDLGSNAMTAYRAGKMAYNAGKAVAKWLSKKPVETVAVEAANAGAKQLASTGATKIVGQVGKKTAESAAKAQLAKSVGTRAATAVGQKAGTAAVSAGFKTIGAKVAAGAAKVAAGVKALAVGAAKAVGAAAGAIAAIAASAGGTLLVIFTVLLAIVLIIAVLFSFVLGDEDKGTSVPEMVQYLEDKNTAWLQEVEDYVNGQPITLDFASEQMNEFTKVGYTYIDSMGNPCVVTDNTKEIVCMAAVHFEQDFSDKDAVFDYLDMVWEKSHKLSYTEGILYACDGTVCLDEAGELNTDAQGYNGDVRYYYCTEDYLNIPEHTDCVAIPGQDQLRLSTDKASARFPDSYGSNTNYAGMSNLLTKSMSEGYGCVEHEGTFYCDHITDYNSEIQVGLVKKSGETYRYLVNHDGCTVKHPGIYESAPHSRCDDADEDFVYYYLKFNSLPTSGTYYFEWNEDTGKYECEYNGRLYRFSGYGEKDDGQYRKVDTIPVWYSNSKGKHVYCISYFECEEGDCDGHSVKYHECYGDHKEKVCEGHVNLTVNMEVWSFDNNMLFYTDLSNNNEETGEFFWDKSNREWAISLLDQDWEELYGVYVPSSLYPESDTIGTVVMPTHANSLPIPLLNQNDYPNDPYGIDGTVASHGCGITCVAMLDSYYKDTITSPAMLGRAFGHYNTVHGSKWTLFAESAETLKIPFEKQTSSWAEVVEALSNGKPVVSIQNESGPFTNGGHFILLTGITPGGRILVNDPNGNNYNKSALQYGFEHGFTQETILQGSSGSYWIYGAKPAAEPEVIVPTE